MLLARALTWTLVCRCHLLPLPPSSRPSDHHPSLSPHCFLLLQVTSGGRPLLSCLSLASAIPTFFLSSTCGTLCSASEYSCQHPATSSYHAGTLSSPLTTTLIASSPCHLLRNATTYSTYKDCNPPRQRTHDGFAEHRYIGLHSQRLHQHSPRPASEALLFRPSFRCPAQA